MLRCPNCGNEDIVAQKFTGPKDENGDRVSQTEYFCGVCGLMQSAREGTPEFGPFYRRWHGHPESYPGREEGES